MIFFLSNFHISNVFLKSIPAVISTTEMTRNTKNTKNKENESTFLKNPESFSIFSKEFSFNIFF